MFNKIYTKNRKAQVGDTVTWFVATVAIVVILAISIFASSFAFGKNAGVNLIETTDVLASKSLFSYVLTKDANGKTTYEQLKEDRNLNEVNGKIAKDIFIEFYKNEYSKIWLGMVSNKQGKQGLSLENNFFGKRGFGMKEEISPSNPSVSETIKLDEEDNLNLLLYGKD